MFCRTHNTTTAEMKSPKFLSSVWIFRSRTRLPSPKHRSSSRRYEFLTFIHPSQYLAPYLRVRIYLSTPTLWVGQHECLQNMVMYETIMFWLNAIVGNALQVDMANLIQADITWYCQLVLMFFGAGMYNNIVCSEYLDDSSREVNEILFFDSALMCCCRQRTVCMHRMRSCCMPWDWHCLPVDEAHQKLNEIWKRPGWTEILIWECNYNSTRNAPASTEELNQANGYEMKCILQRFWFVRNFCKSRYDVCYQPLTEIVFVSLECCWILELICQLGEGLATDGGWVIVVAWVSDPRNPFAWPVWG